MLWGQRSDVDFCDGASPDYLKLSQLSPRSSAYCGLVQGKLLDEDLDTKQKLVLRSCGVQHAYLHLPLAAFEDSGLFCVLYATMDQVRLCRPSIGADRQESII